MPAHALLDHAASSSDLSDVGRVSADGVVGNSTVGIISWWRYQLGRLAHLSGLEGRGRVGVATRHHSGCVGDADQGGDQQDEVGEDGGELHFGWVVMGWMGW